MIAEGPRAIAIRSKLEAAFSPRVLDVSDDSERHRGHSGFREGGESHFNVRIAADAFAGMSRLEKQRAIHSALGKALLDEIHALSLKVEE